MLKRVLMFTASLVLVVASLVSSVWGLNKRGFFNLSKIEIVLSKSFDQPRFLKSTLEDLDLQLAQLKGKSLWSLDLVQIEEELKKLSWISEHQVRRHWPDRLEVSVIPKEVKFLFVGKNGQLFPVLQDGVFLKAVSGENLPDVILLRGDEFVKNNDLLKRAIHLLAEIPEQGHFSKQTISELRYDAKEGFHANLLKSPVRIKLGEEELNLRAERISQVLEYLETHQLDARVIDANLTKKVLVRLRKGP